MKMLLTITSSIAIITGFLAILSGLPTAEYYADTYAIVGGAMFLLQGTLTLIYMDGEK